MHRNPRMSLSNQTFGFSLFIRLLPTSAPVPVEAAGDGFKGEFGVDHVVAGAGVLEGLLEIEAD